MLFESDVAPKEQTTLFVAWQKVVVVGAGVAHAVVAKLPTHKMLLVLHKCPAAQLVPGHINELFAQNTCFASAHLLVGGVYIGVIGSGTQLQLADGLRPIELLLKTKTAHTAHIAGRPKAELCIRQPDDPVVDFC